MASNYTEHLGLCQWEATDQVLREEFNADNAKIDALLWQNRYVIGTYRGSGEVNENTSVNLGFEPSLVIITCSGAMSEDRTAVFTPELPIYYSGTALIAKTTPTGFEVGIAIGSTGQVVPPLTNTGGLTFIYLAFR